MKVKKSPYATKLVDISKESSASLNYRVRRAICDSLEHRYPIDIYNISQMTGIARQTLYNDNEIRTLIEYYKEYCQHRLDSYKGESEKDAKKRMKKFRFLADMPSLQGMEPVMDARGNSHFIQPEDSVAQEELKKVLEQSLEVLTEKERKVITLYYY